MMELVVDSADEATSELRLRDPAEHRLTHVGNAANLRHGKVVGVLLGAGPQHPARVKAFGVVIIDLHDLAGLRLNPVTDFVDRHVREEAKSWDGDVHRVRKATVPHDRASNPNTSLLIKGLREVTLAEPVRPPQRRHVDVKGLPDDRCLDDIAVRPRAVVLGDSRNPATCDLIEVLHQLALQEGAPDDRVAVHSSLADGHRRDVVQVPYVLCNEEEGARLRTIAEDGALGPLFGFAIKDIHEVAWRDRGSPPDGQW